jgi:phage major head subunit gpT-like protein
MDHYREGNINKFAMVGAVTLMVVGTGFWGLRTYAQNGLNKDALEAPWVVAARYEQGGGRPLVRTLAAPADMSEAQEKIMRWRSQNGQPVQ